MQRVVADGCLFVCVCWQPRPGCGVVAKCCVDGRLWPMQTAMKPVVEAAEQQGFRTLYVAEDDEQEAQAAVGGGLVVKGIRSMEELFEEEADQDVWEAAGP